MKQGFGNPPLIGTYQPSRSTQKRRHNCPKHSTVSFNKKTIRFPSSVHLFFKSWTLPLLLIFGSLKKKYSSKNYQVKHPPTFSNLGNPLGKSQFFSMERWGFASENWPTRPEKTPLQCIPFGGSKMLSIRWACNFYIRGFPIRNTWVWMFVSFPKIFLNKNSEVDSILQHFSKH